MVRYETEDEKMAKAKTRAARIEWTEYKDGTMTARLSRADMDQTWDRHRECGVWRNPYRPYYKIDVYQGFSGCDVEFQAAAKGGRRYKTFSGRDSMAQAITHAEKWFARRFRVELAPGEKAPRKRQKAPVVKAVVRDWMERDPDVAKARSLKPGDDWCDHTGEVVGRFVGMTSAGTIYVAYRGQQDYEAKRANFVARYGN